MWLELPSPRLSNSLNLLLGPNETETPAAPIRRSSQIVDSTLHTLALARVTRRHSQDRVRLHDYLCDVCYDEGLIVMVADCCECP